MTQPEQDDPNNDFLLRDLFRQLWGYRQVIWRGALGIALVTALVGGFYFAMQPVRWSASLGFRPVFAGADEWLYPNKLPFSTTDIIDPTVVAQVFEKNHLEDYCALDKFRAGLTVEQSSPESVLLDLEYQARLADTKISVVDRQRIQEEYGAKRQAIPHQFKLTFVRSADCRSIPPAIVFKTLGEVLQTWADDAENKRGVLKIRIAVLSPSIFDVGAVEEQSQLVYADVIRSALTRLVTNIKDVEKMRGSELIRTGNPPITFAEVRAKMEDLVQAGLDPLVSMAGRGLGRESARWIEESLQVALTRQKEARDEAEAHRTALREYSGAGPAPSTPTPGQRPAGPADAQTQTAVPQVDRALVDRIVELQATNTTFRQGLTQKMDDAALLAVSYSSVVDHYTQLLKSVTAGGEAGIPPAVVQQRLAAVVEQAKTLTRQFNALYDEFSRVSLRAGPQLYRVDRPAAAVTLRAFGFVSYFSLVVGAFLVALVVLATGCVLRERFRAFTTPAPRV